MKVDLKNGDRIELIEDMQNDPNPILAGTQGTVLDVTFHEYWNETHVSIFWDNGRKLNAILPQDKIKKID